MELVKIKMIKEGPQLWIFPRPDIKVTMSHYGIRYTGDLKAQGMGKAVRFGFPDESLEIIIHWLPELRSKLAITCHSYFSYIGEPIHIIIA